MVLPLGLDENNNHPLGPYNIQTCYKLKYLHYIIHNGKLNYRNIFLIIIFNNTRAQMPDIVVELNFDSILTQFDF